MTETHLWCENVNKLVQAYQRYAVTFISIKHIHNSHYLLSERLHSCSFTQLLITQMCPSTFWRRATERKERKAEVVCKPLTHVWQHNSEVFVKLVLLVCDLFCVH